MKLDEKYFVPFLAIVAIATALLILFFTVNNQQNREQAFKDHITQQDSLKEQYMPNIAGGDSLRVAGFPDKYVILDFWATWTESFSLDAHKQLASLQRSHPERLKVLAAVVQDKDGNIKEYIERFDFPFTYVEGTDVFNRFGVPGVPTQIVYAPGGRVVSVFTGYADSTRKDSLQTILSDGR